MKDKAFQDYSCCCAENLQFCIKSAGHISFNQVVDDENDINFDENISYRENSCFREEISKWLEW